MKTNRTGGIAAGLCAVSTIGAVAALLLKLKKGCRGEEVCARPIEPVDPADVGFEDYGHLKHFEIDKDKKKNVLITGAGSYIGESFRKYCEEHYPDIKCDTIDMIDGGWKEKSFAGYDTVFHVAGIAHSDTGHTPVEEQERYYKVNTDLAIETAKKAKADGVKQFVFMSSMIIYGGKEYIDDKTIPEPKNFYGNSKWLADKGVRELADENFHVAVLRPPMIYGKGSKGNYPTLAKMAKRLPIFPDVDNQRSMLYIENFCEFLCQLVKKGIGGVYFPQNEEYSNTSNMVKIIREYSGNSIKLTKVMNPAIKCFSKRHGKVGDLINKAFGSMVYEHRLSKYEGITYQKVDIMKSLYYTEYSR